MQDANVSISSTRLNELLSAISDARHSLQEWQDRRTEAMIRLDSFAYDVQKIEEEKARLEQTVLDAKREAEAQARIFQSQIGDLTDSLQMQKLEIEGLRQELMQKDLALEAHKKEQENQKRLKDQLVEAHNKRVAEMEAESQKRHAQTLAREKSAQEGLAAELMEMSKRRLDAEAKLESLEREMNYIRSNMIGLLNPKLLHAEEDLPVANRKRDAASSETHTIRSTTNSGAATVDDYLKRLGY